MHHQVRQEPPRSDPVVVQVCTQICPWDSPLVRAEMNAVVEPLPRLCADVALEMALESCMEDADQPLPVSDISVSVETRLDFEMD